MIVDKNFSNQLTPEADSEYLRCNFCQSAPIDDNGTKLPVRLFPGDDTPRTFTDCNLINCLPPPGSTLINCNTAIIEYGVVTSTEEIEIDGETFFIEHHANKVWGHVNSYLATVYKQIPDLIEVD